MNGQMDRWDDKALDSELYTRKDLGRASKPMVHMGKLRPAQWV